MLVTTPPDADLADLALARELLTSPGMAVQLANLVGAPIEYLLTRQLPAAASRLVESASRKAVETAFAAAVRTLRDRRPGVIAREGLHRAAVLGTGAVGGFFGLAGLAVELPLTTTAMLRSIADIARSEGEDPREVDTRLACLEVLALGGRSRSDDGAESGYFATRAALAQQISAATRHLAGAAANGSAPVLVRLIEGIASRFSIPVSQKALAQAAPIVGAASGAALNLIFISHFQRMARGHFIVRRLERTHGALVIREQWQRLGEAA
ncbi:hypothetical protein P873_08035 [Arenimonas composti TR7-09 = DSM 18010]|uniref:Peptidase n=1 Tax=Arenimonas composti TR7-09 = DSM 18010 TaxID=1121013 RepID=A0A091BBY4_9GAMM|nr:hypothetical protein P873_08035 [Arenimonas composti TR7-09 = DSM 18010]